MQPRTSHDSSLGYRFFAVSSVLISALVFAGFLVAKLATIFPAGVNAKADALYALLPFPPVAIQIAAGSAFALVGLVCRLHRTQRLTTLIGAVLIACGYPEGAFLPLFFAQVGQEPLPSSESRRAQVWTLATTVVLALLFSAAVDFTLATPFPHQLSRGEGFYMLGTAVIHQAVTLMWIGIILAVAQLGRGFLRIRRLDGASGRIVFGLLIYLGSAWHYDALLQAVDPSLNFGRIITLLAALTTASALALLGDPAQPARDWSTLGPMRRALAGKTFWLKAIVFGAVIRELFHIYKISDQDLPTVFFGDVLYFTVPFMALFFASVIAVFLATCLSRLIGNVKAGVLAGLLLVLAVLPTLRYDTQAWTAAIEHNRPFANYLTRSKRTALRFFGLERDRPAARKYRLLEEAVKERAKTITPDAMQPSFVPAATPAGPSPHILMFISDATTRLHLGAYGYERDTTPVLSAFVKDGALIRNYFSTASDTYQDVLSIFSGEFAGRKALLSNTDRSRLCELLVRHGYKIFIADGMRPYKLMAEDGHCVGYVPLSFFGDAVSDWEIVRTSLKEHPETPHFVYVHVHGGHNPWAPPEDQRPFGGDRIGLYDGALRVADRQFGEWQDVFHATGSASNLLSIFTADHGIGLGRHLDLGSYSNLYAQNIDVPLIIKGPGINPGEIKDGVAAHIDILPTLAEYLDGTASTGTSGISLLPALRGGKLPEQRCVFATAAYSNAFSMQCGSGQKVIIFRDLATVDVYDFLNDPEEEKNLVDNLSDAQFLSLAAPLIEFLARGANTYAVEM